MDGLSAMLNLVNYVFVLIFGIVVSFYFADITWEDNKKIIISTLVAFALLQAVCYVLLGERILYKSYPFIIHIPLILVIRYVCHKNIYISTIAVLSAYLMCTPRKWFGTVAAYIIKDIPMISDIVTIIITIPLLFIVIKYISPYIIKLENESKTILSIFFFLPLTYYISEYAFTVYTDLLYRGETIVIEFMDSFIVILLCLHRSFLSRLTLSFCVPTFLIYRSTGISTCCPSATSFDLALGPDLPRADQLYPGNLRYSAMKILTSFSLLIPAFSLLSSPPLLPVWLRSANNAPLPTFLFLSFGVVFQPRTFSAQDLSTSELLRTLLMYGCF